MKSALFALSALVLAACNASDVVLYGAAGAGDTLGDAAVGNASATETGGSDHAGGTGNLGGATQSAAGSNSGGAVATGGSTNGGDTSTTGGAAQSGGTDAAGGSGDVTGSGGESFQTCTKNDDCPSPARPSPTWYCLKATCDDAEGICAPTPVLCDGATNPVCGCDNVTYLNSCVRASFGVSSERAPHECGDPSAHPPCMNDTDCPSAPPPCMTDEDCGPDLKCAHLLPRAIDMCAPWGTCWGIPPDCEGDGSDTSNDGTTMSGDGSDMRHWIPCDQPVDYSMCLSTCAAIQSGGIYVPGPLKCPQP